jgi:ketosteroid isomerase-like protein/uncharacterized protein YciI
MATTPDDANFPSVQNPEEINERFRDAFNARNLDRLVELYEPNAVLVPAQDASAVRGIEGIAESLRLLLALGGTINFTRRHCLVHDELALLSIDWHLRVESRDTGVLDVRATSLELARRQASGSWKYVIDHPFGATQRVPPAPASSAPRSQWVIRFEPVRGLLVLSEPTADEKTVMQAHRDYVKALAAHGRLILTGLSPTAQDVHGISIVEVDSDSDAARIMADDPFVASGMMKAELRPFRTVMSRSVGE